MSTLKPSYNVPTIDDVEVIKLHGPWNTKSGGVLSVLFALPLDVLTDRYLHYEDEELAKVPGDIRGLRAYAVRDLPKGSLGANEWHKIRAELVFAIGGPVHWTCEDVFGRRKEFTLDEATGVWTPPYILHTYRAEGEGAGVLVLANTLFDPENPATHDTYSAEVFAELQASYK